jgi:hypothetical protein
VAWWLNFVELGAKAGIAHHGFSRVERQAAEIYALSQRTLKPKVRALEAQAGAIEAQLAALRRAPISTLDRPQTARREDYLRYLPR